MLDFICMASVLPEARRKRTSCIHILPIPMYTTSISSKMMKWIVFCLGNVLFLCYILNIAILYKSKGTHKSCVCFKHANTRSGRMLDRVMHVESKHMTCASLCYLHNKAIFRFGAKTSFQ